MDPPHDQPHGPTSYLLAAAEDVKLSPLTEHEETQTVSINHTSVLLRQQQRTLAALLPFAHVHARARARAHTHFLMPG